MNRKIKVKKIPHISDISLILIIANYPDHIIIVLIILQSVVSSLKKKRKQKAEIVVNWSQMCPSEHQSYEMLHEKKNVFPPNHLGMLHVTRLLL